MATYTDNYTMTKPTYAEQADISVINANMDIIDSVMHSSQISLAPAYDINETYNTGDIVMHELLMYKCLEDNVTGVWDSTKWTRTTAGEESGGGADLDIYGEASGTAEASFSDGAEASLVECEIGIVPTQDLHGYSKPWAGGAGKNKLPNNASSVTINNVEFTINSDGSVLATGTATANTVLLIWNKVNDKLLDDGNYILTGCPSGGSDNTFYLGTNGFGSAKDTGNGSNMNVISSQNQTNVLIYINSGYIIPDEGLLFQPMIRESTTPSGFEPYSNICPISGHTDVTVTVASTSGGSGDDTTVSLGRTVYKGWVNLSTGEGAITGVGVDLGSFNWVSENTALSGLARINVAEVLPLGAVYNQIPICSQYEGKSPKSYSQFADGEIAFSNSESQPMIRMRDENTSGMTDAQIKSYMSGVTFCYDLATPQTFTLTKEQIQTLLGQNYVSHDGGGTISLVYIKKDSTIIPNPSDAEVPLTGLEISGKGFKITDARIPAPPTNNGAYVLTVTVSGGTPTYSWENA